MNKDEINLIKKLDPEGINGTIQSLLLRDDLNTVVFKEALVYLLRNTLNERQAYMDENKKLTEILKKHNLYTTENLFGDK